MLFFKECKKVLFSLTFLIYFIAVIAMYFTQFHNDCKESIYAPLPDQESYGMIAKEVPDILMPAATESLVNDYLSDSYTAYPIGFYKNVHLSEKKKQKMAEIITEISGISKEDLDNCENYEEGGFYMDENGEMMQLESNIPEINIPKTLTYERFRELMKEADDIIGGGSEYSDENIVGNFSLVPKTYKDALTEYNKFLNEDKITGAYARLFCDYMGIVIAILPVFVAVSLVSLDKKSHMEQLAYSRKISSVKLIFARYFALVALLLIPVAITALIANFKVCGMYPNNSTDIFTIFKYSAAWLIPNIMTSAAVGMLMTELTSSLLAIFVQGVWWFSSIFASASGLTGCIGKFTLVARHNSLYGLDTFMNNFNDFLFNRIFYTVISLIAIALTAFIYEQKRKGIFNGYSFRFKISKHKS